MTWCISRDRAGDERKDEYSRLEAVIEKHQGLIPRVMETQVKSEVSNLFATNIPIYFFGLTDFILAACMIQALKVIQLP